jgi:hypothetical protein
MGRRDACRVFVGAPEGEAALKPRRIGIIILKWMLKKYEGREWNVKLWLRIERSGWLL